MTANTSSKGIVRVTFINFWPGFVAEEVPLLGYLTHALAKCRWALVKVPSQERADLVVSSVFGSERVMPGRKSLLLIGEPDHHIVGSPLLDPENHWDLTLGFHPEEDDRHMRFPGWLSIEHYYKRTEDPAYVAIKENRRPEWDPTRKPASLVAGNGVPFRYQLLDAFMNQGVHVDCPGAVGRNVDPIPSGPLAKHEFVSQYYFNLCPENGYQPGYVTEKPFDAVQALAIPVYHGDPALEPGVLNPDRIIFVNNATEAAARVADLLKNEEALKDFFTQPIYQPGAASVIDKFVSQFEQRLQRLLGLVLN